MNIGIAGVGKMGAAIAARLMEVGNQMTVWNRSPEKTKPLADAGAKIAATPADLAKAVDAVITILTDAAAINATYGGPSGLLAAELKGRLFIDMSTVQPQTEIALAEKKSCTVRPERARLPLHRAAAGRSFTSCARSPSRRSPRSWPS